MGNLGKLDKLTRSFLEETSNPALEFDAFKDLQDPTYMSFKLNFFPHLGMGVLNDAFSTSGLFRAPKLSSENYAYFRDSAYEYLGNIGSPTRQAYHKAFTNMLWRIQEEAPWYFQSISGLGDLYKIDPNMNFRGKDKILTIECLETIDMRMSYLADLYRNMSFDMYHMREILPVNLRTFNMEIYVLEFRRFNTTWGKISQTLSTKPRLGNEEAQKNSIPRNTTNVSDLAGEVSALNGISESAFEAVSVQVFKLQDCEFDFFSESHSYLDTVSVADNTNPATTKFKIKVGRIEKAGLYPFHKFVISEHIQNTMFNDDYLKTLVTNGVIDTGNNWAEPYIEATPPRRELQNEVVNFFRNYRESIYPTATGYSPTKADSESYKEYRGQSDSLGSESLRKKLGGVMENENNYTNNSLRKKINEMSGGLIGNIPLGNVYGRGTIINRIRQALSDFSVPGQPTNKQLGNVLEEASTSSRFVKEDIITEPVQQQRIWTKRNVYDGRISDTNSSTD